MIVLRCLPYVFRQVSRHLVRSTLTIAGIMIAMFLFTAVQSMHHGVQAVTQASATETTLVVYREDRYCPATSELPQDYRRRIEAIPGVVSAIPIKVVVSNCRTSLDVVTFRGVPKDAFLAERAGALELVEGSADEWLKRSDAALVGETLARRRGLRPGMTFDAAGITAVVAGVIRSDEVQDQNVAYTDLDYVQLASQRGLGLVTQFNVKIDDPSRLDAVSRAIDDEFAHAQQPTATFSEQAFIGRVAGDLVELVGFARWLGIGSLVAVLALVANSIVLGVQSRIAEHAVLQTLGFSQRLVAVLIVIEGLVLSLLGGALGAGAAVAVAEFGHFAFSIEGTSVPITADGGLLLRGALICAGIGVIAGLAPAIQAARRPIAATFRVA